MISHLMLEHAAAREEGSADSPPTDPGDVTPERLVGRYQLTPNFVFDVRNDNGRLFVTITNQPTNEVFADSPTQWSYRGIDAKLEFKLGRTGPARNLVLHQNGIQQTARRIVK